MTRRRRTRILVEGNPEIRRNFSANIESRHSIVEIEPPGPVLTMIKMRDTARKSLFYLGEVLVTEAKVRVNETIGLGIIAGDNEEAARDLAVIDAALRANLPETADWYSRLVNEEQRIRAHLQRHHARIDETRVRFETLDEG